MGVGVYVAVAVATKIVNEPSRTGVVSSVFSVL